MKHQIRARQQIQFKIITDRSKENNAPLFYPKYQHNFKSTMFRSFHRHQDSGLKRKYYHNCGLLKQESSPFH